MRWFVLFLGMLANLVQGMAYAGSVISIPLLGIIGITGNDAVKQHWAGIFSLSCLLLPIGMLTAGKLASKYSPRLPIALGAIFYSAGLLLSPYATNYTMLCFTFGVMLSLGSGFAYGPILAAAVQRFPDKKGLAGGLSVSALGLGPVVIAPVCAYLLKHSFSITAVLQLFGVFALAAVGLAACFTGRQSAVIRKQEAAGASMPTADYQLPAFTWNEMIKQRRFWLLSTLLFLGAVPGLMLISNANNIFCTLGGFGPEQAAWLVAVLGAANAAGRFLWGTVSDFAGRTNVLTVMFALSAAAMFALAFYGTPHEPGVLASASYLLIAASFVVVTTYGGYLGLFPSFCAEAFGLKNMAVNYAVLFIAFSAASFAGPRIYALLEPQTAFCLAGTLCCLGFAASRKS